VPLPLSVRCPCDPGRRVGLGSAGTHGRAVITVRGDSKLEPPVAVSSAGACASISAKSVASAPTEIGRSDLASARPSTGPAADPAPASWVGGGDGGESLWEVSPSASSSGGDVWCARPTLSSVPCKGGDGDGDGDSQMSFIRSNSELVSAAAPCCPPTARGRSADSAEVGGGFAAARSNADSADGSGGDSDGFCRPRRSLADAARRGCNLKGCVCRTPSHQQPSAAVGCMSLRHGGGPIAKRGGFQNDASPPRRPLAANTSAPLRSTGTRR
jgi:hypothetical protein